MPVRFRVRAAGAVERVVEIGAPGAEPREIRIGRGADVELPLPFTALSELHARIRRAPDGDGWLVEGLASELGTSVGGERLVPGVPRALAPGAELVLGPAVIVFDGEAATGAPVGPKAEGTATIARRLVSDLFAARAPGSTPELEVVAGPEPGQRLVLGDPGRPYLVGRGAGCALPLVVDEISREHAVFVWTAEGVVVRDLGSKNGVLVAGARIAPEQRLHHGDLVEIGPVTLRLRDPVDRYLAELAVAAGPVAPPPEVAVAASAPGAPAFPGAAADGARGSRAGVVLAGIAIGVLVAVAGAAIALFIG